ncbi:Thioesterase/thiol ester dehydrase-isomerase [Schizophyllum commune H4-8]|uniref:Thioesterase domain-containing protein n=1 Tax=Schizophyllum commune (strain H4-8 / FGSC 9210) TaxID=578458 RepID=D8PXX4_SCHCM|nr:Thioesterase/thiol ester dehydrase-isomerase [Schizophyllum commune H4-8]KAI5897088.1 Thioesterase/thiol ester dehydrase-isomerase [Schizophyllum commune H4-8]
MTEPQRQQQTEAELLSYVQAFWARQRDTSPLYSLLIPDLTIISATRGRVLAQMRVAKQQLNSKGTLHGTTSACLLDWGGGIAIASHGVEKTGVTTDLHVSCLAPAKEGDLLEIECIAEKVGRSVAYTTVTVRKVIEGGDSIIVSSGRHTKFL